MRTLVLVLVLAGTATAQDTARSRAPVVAVSAALFSAATFDIEMTVTCIRRYANEPEPCREMNALARPLFGEDGRRFPAYAVAAVGYGSLMLLSNHWRQQGRRYWWVAPAALVVIHTTYAAKGVRDMRRGGSR